MTVAAKSIELKHQLLFWTAFFALIIILMWLLGDVLLPFVAGMAIAYLCNPLTNWLERWRVPRWLGALIVLALVLLFFVLLILLIAPVIGSQLTGFIHDLPGYISKLQALISDPSRPWLSKIAGESLPGADTSAADLIKQAMVAVQNWLEERKLQTKLIMQVHDELVLEVPEKELDEVKEKIRELMQNVAKLDVPLIVDVGVGENWDQAH